MTDPPPIDYRNPVDPRPVLTYPRRQAGDQMAFGFGCLASLLLPLPIAAAVVAVLGDHAGSVILAACVATSVLVGLGLIIGWQTGRWGFLKAVGVSLVLAGGVIAVVRAAA